MLFTVGSSVLGDIPTIIGTVKADKDDTFFGWQIVALGDQNHDGYADFMVHELVRQKTYIYFGGPTIATTPALVFDSVVSPMSNIEDINGDTVPDFCIRSVRLIDTCLSLFYGGTPLNSEADGCLGTSLGTPRGLARNTRDINQNGLPDLITWAANQQSLAMFELDSTYIYLAYLVINPPVPPESLTYRIGDGLAVGDFNGDGISDIATNLRRPPIYMENGRLLFYWGGTGFDSIPDLSIRRPGPYQDGYYQFGKVLENIGDVNNDGYEDILAGPGSQSADSVTFIYFGGPGIDTIPDIIIPLHAYFSAPAGDVNHDGYPDWLSSYPLGSSSLDYVNVYFGGPAVDSLADIRISISDMPIHMVQWGLSLAGLGDVNGDGIDDFAASGLKFGDTGMVVVFAGQGAPTEVKPRPSDHLPFSFILGQNYPNPFNPTTTIEFELPHRSAVKLEILNLLGQHVHTLLHKTLSVGVYQIEWDGKEDHGKDATSGTYFYRLTAGQYSEVKKMILVR